MALVYGLLISQISLDSSQVHEPFEYGHQKAETVSLHLSIFDPLQEFSFSLPLIFNFRFEYNGLRMVSVWHNFCHFNIPYFTRIMSLLSCAVFCLRSKSLFGLLCFHLFLKLCSSRLKFFQSLLQISHFLLDLAELCLSLAAGQAVGPKLLCDVLLKLTPQDLDIRVAPHRSLSVFESAGPDAFHLPKFLNSMND